MQRLPAQITVLLVIRPRGCVTPASSAAVTGGFSISSTPIGLSCRSAFLDDSSDIVGSTRDAAYMRMIRALCDMMWRKPRLSTRSEISANAPASSTPVGPPPTITKVSQRHCASRSFDFSAAS
jgi:hypothetical protein